MPTKKRRCRTHKSMIKTRYSHHQDGKNNYFLEKVKRIRVDEKAYGTEETTEVEYLVFEFQHQRYLYDAAEDNFFVQQYAK